MQAVKEESRYSDKGKNVMALFSDYVQRTIKAPIYKTTMADVNQIIAMNTMKSRINRVEDELDNLKKDINKFEEIEHKNTEKDTIQKLNTFEVIA